MKEIMENFINGVTSIFIGIVFIILIAIISIICKQCINTPPVKETKIDVIDIDSINKVNDSIKINVQHLDSIKNAKVIEVISLDNDSTIKLFYKLVSE